MRGKRSVTSPDRCSAGAERCKRERDKLGEGRTEGCIDRSTSCAFSHPLPPIRCAPTLSLFHPPLADSLIRLASFLASFALSLSFSDFISLPLLSSFPLTPVLCSPSAYRDVNDALASDIDGFLPISLALQPRRSLKTHRRIASCSAGETLQQFPT